MRPGDLAVKIGDGGDHRRPSLGRRVIVRPVIAARMESEIVAPRKFVMPRSRR